MTAFNKLSEQFLLAVKTSKDTLLLVEKLGAGSILDLQQQLSDDYSKKAFWINIYNTFFQILRKDYGLKKPNIYLKKRINIAGVELSLDDIEHGILRRYRYKYSLGYFANPLTPSHIKKLALSTLDYRIHFALNCGAVSCPPIAFYNAEKIEEQLEIATFSFLEIETKINQDKKEVYVTRLMKWFMGDFGGLRGIRKILSARLNKDFSGYKIVFSHYSWEEQLDNYNQNNFDHGDS